MAVASCMLKMDGSFFRVTRTMVDYKGSFLKFATELPDQILGLRLGSESIRHEIVVYNDGNLLMPLQWPLRKSVPNDPDLRHQINAMGSVWDASSAQRRLSLANSRVAITH
jgi:hypothetical protein